VLARRRIGLSRPVASGLRPFGGQSYAVRIGKPEGDNHYVMLESGGAEKDKLFLQRVLLVPKSRLEDTLKKRSELVEKRQPEKK
jgi:hypothetical protein